MMKRRCKMRIRKKIKVWVGLLLFIFMIGCLSRHKMVSIQQDHKKSQKVSIDQKVFQTPDGRKGKKISEKKEKEQDEIDLTVMSSTTVYAEVYNMMCTPEDYVGKHIKIEGSFDVYKDKKTGKRYFSCVVSDATACCFQGLEFELKGKYRYPDDYPKVNDTIRVEGTFETYQEDGENYCRLKDASLKVL